MRNLALEGQTFRELGNGEVKRTAGDPEHQLTTEV